MLPTSLDGELKRENIRDVWAVWHFGHPGLAKL